MTEVAGPARATLSPTASSALLTFLIADVRGYTRFTVEQGDEAAARLAGRFAELTEEVVRRHDGQVIELRGDEALCVFPSARNALRAAVALQAAFRDAVQHNPTLPLNVGIGLDAGEAVPVSGGYRGGALNLAARLCSIAGSGEIFCSEGVIHLARKTEGIAFVDRGEVSLKGLSAPVRVIQIGPEGELPEQLPPLQPMLVTHPTNLPDEPTPFIGREREIEQIAGLLQDPHIRMVTLTGPGGTGKTRLALQAGGTLHDFRDGVFFVNLAPLADPALVPSAMAEVLGVKQAAGKDLLESLIDHLESKRILLVLDNYEHLLESSSVVASLLDRCQELHVLVTSRIPLHLSREHEHAVPPLSIPDPQHLPDLETLTQYEAVALFIERARAAKDSFAVTNDNAPAVAEICYRLDGLPLAIELAAARIKLFPPQALLPRLDSRLKLLVGGARDKPTRQQTLRGAIDWSYSLLSSDEQTIFARLSVFSGGCSFEAAEAVCNPSGELDLLEALASLVDKSLLRQEGEEEPRLGMLETIREYAAERLEASGCPDESRAAHADYFYRLIENMELELVGANQVAWMRRLDRELDNIRAALSWYLNAGKVREELHLAATLWRYWDSRALFEEGRRWLSTGLAKEAPVPADRVHQRLGMLVWRQGNLGEAKRLLERSLEESQRLGDDMTTAAIWSTLGNILSSLGHYEESERLHRQSIALRRSLGDGRFVAHSLSQLGRTLVEQGRSEEARPYLEESLALSREANDAWFIGITAGTLGAALLQLGDVNRAATLLEQSLEVLRDLGEQPQIYVALRGMLAIFSIRGQAIRAARLAGALDRLDEAYQWNWRVKHFNAYLAAVQGHTARVQAALGHSSWDRERESGRAMSLEEAVAYALGQSE